MHLAIKRAGVAVLMTSGALALGAGPAQAGEPVTLTGDETATWSGGGTGAYLAYPLLACSGLTPADACDAKHITVEPANEDVGPAALSIAMTPASDLDDFDLYVYRDADADGNPEEEIVIEGATQGEGAGVAEWITIPNATGTYLVEIVNFLSLEGAFEATATLDSPAAAEEAEAARVAAAADRTATETALTRALAAARR